MATPGGSAPLARRPRSRHFRDGDYLGDRLDRRLIDYARANVDSRRPMSPWSAALLSDYLRRRAFSGLVEIRGVSVEFAASVHLGGVKLRQAQSIRKEMADAGGALAWFRAEFLAGLDLGKVTPPILTRPSPEADLLFESLAATADEARSILVRVLGGRAVVTPEAISKARGRIELAVVEYHTSRLMEGKADGPRRCG